MCSQVLQSLKDQPKLPSTVVVQQLRQLEKLLSQQSVELDVPDSAAQKQWRNALQEFAYRPLKQGLHKWSQDDCNGQETNKWKAFRANITIWTTPTISSRRSSGASTGLHSVVGPSSFADANLPKCQQPSSAILPIPELHGSLPPAAGPVMDSQEQQDLLLGQQVRRAIQQQWQLLSNDITGLQLSKVFFQCRMSASTGLDTVTPGYWPGGPAERPNFSMAISTDTVEVVLRSSASYNYAASHVEGEEGAGGAFHGHPVDAASGVCQQRFLQLLSSSGKMLQSSHE